MKTAFLISEKRVSVVKRFLYQAFRGFEIGSRGDKKPMTLLGRMPGGKDVEGANLLTLGEEELT